MLAVDGSKCAGLERTLFPVPELVGFIRCALLVWRYLSLVPIKGFLQRDGLRFLSSTHGVVANCPFRLERPLFCRLAGFECLGLDMPAAPDFNPVLQFLAPLDGRPPPRVGTKCRIIVPKKAGQLSEIFVRH